MGRSSKAFFSGGFIKCRFCFRNIATASINRHRAQCKGDLLSFSGPQEIVPNNQTTIRSSTHRNFNTDSCSLSQLTIKSTDNLRNDNLNDDNNLVTEKNYNNHKMKSINRIKKLI